jgi:hypothetical protein
MRKLFALILLVSTSAFADCNFSSYKEGFFSNSKTKDKLYSKIIGKNCIDAKQVLVIESSEGNEIYRYEDKNVFKNKSQELEKDYITTVLNWPLREPLFSNADSLPDWDHVEANPFDYFITFSIDKQKYTDYRENSWKVYSHAVGYESGKTIIYDQSERKVVVLFTTDP